MAENTEKKKRFTSEELHERGAVGFTMDDVRQAQNQQDSPNAKAYELMVEAMAVSANYASDTITDEGDIRLDDVYPTTLDETLRMDQLLDQSERAVKDDNDADYNRLILELRGIVGWSRRRHFNFSWGIIFGTIITIAAVMYWSSSDQDEKARSEARVEKVKAWNVESDSISLATALKTVSHENYLNSPNYFKADQINTWQNRLDDAKKNAADDRQKADTCSSNDARKRYLEWAERQDKKAAEAEKRLAEAKEWDLKDSQKAALKLTKGWLSRDARAAAFSYCFMIFFLLLIPLYIFANHSWGYVITRHRRESEILAKIKAWGFSIAAGMFGAAAALEFFPETKVTTYWSDGSTTTHTESNPLDMLILALKIGLVIAAICVIALVSTGIMIYSTIVGLKRNYDWKAIYAEAKAKGVAAKNVAENLTKKA